MPRRILRAEMAADGAFSLTAGARIVWEKAEIARLRPGASILRPAVEILPSEFLDGAARERLRIRLTAFVNAEIGAKLAPLFQAIAAPAPELRGLIHRMGESLGVLPAEILPPEQRPLLKKSGIIAGRLAVFMPVLLKPGPAAMRALLWALWTGRDVPKLPGAGLVSVSASADWDEKFALAMGWVLAGPVMIRLDIAEKLSRELNYLIRRHPVALPAGIGSRMSLKPEHLSPALNALGFRIIPSAALSPDAFGPPAPRMLARRKGVAAKPAAPASAPLPDNPFAALAVLKRAAS
jgi:ATP-dependent RNA helicase SUPV3L1/SUV3